MTNLKYLIVFTLSLTLLSQWDNLLDVDIL
jgi:hypothetical protein